MPANRTQRTWDLLDRYNFTCTVLLSEAVRIHDMRGCCLPDPCRTMQALTASVDRLSQEALEMYGDLAPKRRTTPKRPQTSVYPTGSAAEDIDALRYWGRADPPPGTTEF